jgi:hypothetical protein
VPYSPVIPGSESRQKSCPQRRLFSKTAEVIVKTDNFQLMAMAWVKYPEGHDDYYVWLAVAVEIMGGVWSIQRIPPTLGLLPC